MAPQSGDPSFLHSMRFLARAGAALAASLDYDTTLLLLGNLAVEHLAEWCVVDLVDETGTWRRRVVAHTRPEDQPLADQLRHFPCIPNHPNDLYPPHRALQARETVLLAHFDPAEIPRLAQNPEHAALIAKTGLRSLIAAPLAASGHVLGLLLLGRTHRQEPFGELERILVEDLASRASLAVENAHLYRRSQQASEMRESFLTIASHELRTPLTSLLLQADGLVRALDKEAELPKERLRTRLERILKQAERLQRLIENLLDVSRISRGAFGPVEKIDVEKVDLVEVTLEIVRRFQAEAEHSRCPTHVHSDGPVVASVDRVRVEQVVTNLLDNAIRYGRGRPIELTVADGPDAISLQVRDHGIGIDPLHHALIFERFGRASSEKNYGGLGLGLWIVRQIVEAMGGGVRVESALGAGATFTVSLPRDAPT